MGSRLVLLPDAREPLLARVRELAKERSVLIVSATRPMISLRDELAGAGADMDHVFIVDVVTDELQAIVQDPEHEAYVPNASLLELIASRVRRIIIDKAERPTTIIVDDVASFAKVAPTAALVEIASIVANWTGRKNIIEYVLRPGSIKPDADAHVKAALDEVRTIQADGTLA